MIWCVYMWSSDETSWTGRRVVCVWSRDSAAHSAFILSLRCADGGANRWSVGLSCAIHQLLKVGLAFAGLYLTHINYLWPVCALKTTWLVLILIHPLTPLRPLLSFFLLRFLRSLGKADFQPIPLKGRSIKRYIVISPCRHLNQWIFNRTASVGPLKGPVSFWAALGQGRCGQHYRRCLMRS